MRATITSKGQITLPKALRTHMGLKPGDEIVFFPKEKGFEARKTVSIHDLYGCLPKPEKALTIEEMDEAIGDYLTEKYSHGDAS